MRQVFIPYAYVILNMSSDLTGWPHSVEDSDSFFLLLCPSLLSWPMGAHHHIYILARMSQEKGSRGNPNPSF